MTVAIINGSEIELPKYTLAVAEELDSVGKTKSLKEKAKRMYAAMESMLGGDAVRDACDGESYDDCDLVELVNIYETVNDAYAYDMQRSSREKMDRDMASVRSIADSINKVTSAAKTAKSMK